MTDLYQNRNDAGKILASMLAHYANRQDVLVLALPRGGVPVAFEIAKTLNAPLDVFIVRKLGLPGHAELAMGAIASGGTTVFNQDVLDDFQIDERTIQEVTIKELTELNRRESLYRGEKAFPSLKNKTIILVDDGIATGATMRAAILALRQLKPEAIVIAVPVSAKSTIDTLQKLVDEFICPLRPLHFHAVGAWYEQFPQTQDEEVHALLHEAKTQIP